MRVCDGPGCHSGTLNTQDVSARGSEDECARGRRICARCCVEVGAEGRAWCFGCYEDDGDEGEDEGKGEMDEGRSERVRDWLEGCGAVGESR